MDSNKTFDYLTYDFRTVRPYTYVFDKKELGIVKKVHDYRCTVLGSVNLYSKNWGVARIFLKGGIKYFKL